MRSRHIQAIDRWKLHLQFSTLAFLSEFKSALGAENLDLEFDYFAFCRCSCQLLEKIEAAVLPLVQPRLNERAYAMAETKKGVTLSPGSVNHLACDTAKAPGLKALKDPEGTVR